MAQTGLKLYDTTIFHELQFFFPERILWNPIFVLFYFIPRWNSFLYGAGPPHKPLMQKKEK